MCSRMPYDLTPLSRTVLGFSWALAGFLLSVFVSPVTYFVPSLALRPPVRQTRLQAKLQQQEIKDASTTRMPGSLPETSRTAPSRPVMSHRHVSFPEDLSRPVSAGDRRNGRKKSLTLPSITRAPSSNARDRAWNTLPVLQEDYKEDRPSSVNEFGGFHKLSSPDPSTSASSSPPMSPEPFSMSAVASLDSSETLVNSTSEIRACCVAHGRKHCPFHRHLCRPRNKSSPNSPPQRTQPYAAPYFFPTPDSPEAADYVRSLQAERRRTAHRSASYDVPVRPATAPIPVSPQVSAQPSPKGSPKILGSPGLPSLEGGSAGDSSRENLIPSNDLPIPLPQRRRSWLSIGTSRPGAPSGDGDGTERRRSWHRTHSRNASAEEMGSKERTPTSSKPGFFRRSGKA